MVPALWGCLIVSLSRPAPHPEPTPKGTASPRDEESKAAEGKKGKTQAAMQTFEATRPVVGSQALGIARAAYEYALDYAKEREQFGKKIIENQAIAFALANMKL